MIQDRPQLFVGTLLYAPISAHSLRTTSIKDDLESLGYTVLSLLARHQGLWFN
jgi:hypothetical protein